MEGPLIHGRFTKETQGDLIRFPVLAGEGDARRQRNLSADNRMTAKKIDVRIEQVHRATFTTRTAAGLAVKFGHDSLGRDALGNRLTMFTVTGKHVIVASQYRD